MRSGLVFVVDRCFETFDFGVEKREGNALERDCQTMPSLEVVEIDVGMQSDATVDFDEEQSDPKSSLQNNDDNDDSEKPEATAEATVSEASSTSEATAAAKHVTPAEESVSATGCSKQKQQRKVNQMTLDSLVFGIKKSKTRQTSPVTKKRTRKPTRGKSSAPTKTDTTVSQKTEQEEKSPVKIQKQTKIQMKPKSVKKTPKSGESTDAKTDVAEDPDPKEAEQEKVSSAVEHVEVDLTEESDSTENAAKSTTDDTKETEASTTPPKETDSSRKPKPSRETTTKETSEVESDPTEEQQKEIETITELPEDRKELLQKYTDMKTRYSRRSQELVEEARKGLPEEDFAMPEPQPNKEESSLSEDSFPDYVIANMAVLIEGSSLSLSKLTDRVSEKLSECHGKTWDRDSLTSKIKLLAKRKSFIDIESSGTPVDLFEDQHHDRMWRWEFSTLEIMSSQILPKVRKARAARKKISYHRTATTRLLQALNEAEAVISNPELPKTDKQIAKVSQNEEKVLKYEREAEKKRMAEQAKLKKQEEIESKKRKKQEELESKKREKELEKERKKLEAEKKKEEAEVKKQEAAKAREEAKQKKIAEKEEKKRVEEEKKRAVEESRLKKMNMQKACLMSFFAGPPSKKAKTETKSFGDSNSTNGNEALESTKSACDSFDVDNFRSLIDSADSHETKKPMFSKLSRQAISSRKRRTRKVALSVYVTIMPEENAWDAQPFAEQREIMVPNKYQFLSFHEDCRPPYHGTWSKTSSIVTGRNPFGKDTTYLDYDYDSEAEWEEGDDEVGEDIEDEAKCQDEDMDEDGDARLYDYDDGFCVADDRYLETDDDVDEETKELYKKKLQTGEGQGSTAGRVCIIAPVSGGLPATGCTFSSNVIEGFEKQEGINLMSSHQGMELVETVLCLDAFPPAMIDEAQAPLQPATATSPSATTGKDEYSNDAMIILARFAHHCELNSKEKLIEAVRSEHPDTFFSRAKATRKLDAIATKKRRVHSSGVYWEVKTEILEELGLQDLLKLNADPEPIKEQAKDETAKGNNSSKASSKGKKTKGKKKAEGKKRKLSDQASSEAAKQKKAKTNVKPSSPKKETSLNASANLLKGFLIKKKPKNTSPDPKPTSLS